MYSGDLGTILEILGGFSVGILVISGVGGDLWDQQLRYQFNTRFTPLILFFFFLFFSSSYGSPREVRNSVSTFATFVDKCDR